MMVSNAFPRRCRCGNGWSAEEQHANICKASERFVDGLFLLMCILPCFFPAVRSAVENYLLKVAVPLLAAVSYKRLNHNQISQEAHHVPCSSIH